MPTEPASSSDVKPPKKPAAKRVRKPKPDAATKTPTPELRPASSGGINAPVMPVVPTFIESAPRLFGRPIEWAGVDRGTLLTRLTTLGWVPKTLTAPDDRDIQTALLAYQKFFGIHEGDGHPDAETIRSLNQQRMCGYPDILPLQAGLGAWASKDITWNLQVPNWPRIGTQAALDAFQMAWGWWAAVCDIRPKYVTDPSQAMVVTSLGTIDGPFGVLALSQLPGPGNTMRLTQQFDQSEAWAVGATVPNGQIDITRVSAHEIGHILGLPHISVGNLLAPIYSPQIRVPQAGDIQQVVARYGASTVQPPATTTPANPSAGVPTWITIQDASGKPLSQYRIQSA